VKPRIATPPSTLPAMAPVLLGQEFCWRVELVGVGVSEVAEGPEVHSGVEAIRILSFHRSALCMFTGRLTDELLSDI
jgi:hypothetical protein